jgi:hypothetical protein
MTRHLQSCRAREETASSMGGAKARPVRFLHLVASGRHNPEYWIHLEIPADATLHTLDYFLRDIWLECCGHLSAFRIGGSSYAVMVDRTWGMDDRSMNVALGRVMHVGDRFDHEYDFGTSTYLTLKVVGERTGPGPARGKHVELMARNLPPHIPCVECGKDATQVCSMCIWEGGGWLCAEHSPEHECGEDMLLPVVNSPRVGMCGYTG